MTIDQVAMLPEPVADSGAWTPSARQGNPLEGGHTRRRDGRLSACPIPSPPLETKFDVKVIFRMTPEDLARPACDLDNFAKPVLDTLFTSQNVSRRHRRAFPGVNDTWVFRLRPREGRSGASAGPGCRHHGHSAPAGYAGSQRCFGFSLRAKRQPSAGAANRIPRFRNNCAESGAANRIPPLHGKQYSAERYCVGDVGPESRVAA